MANPTKTAKKAVSGDRCRCCGEADPNKLEVDHIHPKNRGGADHPDNYSRLCQLCNSNKADRAGCALHDRVLIRRSSAYNPNDVAPTDQVRLLEEFNLKTMLERRETVFFWVSQYLSASSNPKESSNYSHFTAKEQAKQGVGAREPRTADSRKWRADIVAVFGPNDVAVFFKKEIGHEWFKSRFAETHGGAFGGVVVERQNEKSGSLQYELDEDLLSDDEKKRCRTWEREHIKGSKETGWWLKGDDVMAELYLKIKARRTLESVALNVRYPDGLSHSLPQPSRGEDGDWDYLSSCAARCLTSDEIGKRETAIALTYEGVTEKTGGGLDMTSAAADKSFMDPLPSFDGELNMAEVDAWLASAKDQ